MQGMSPVGNEFEPEQITEFIAMHPADTGTVGHQGTSRGVQ